jgi:hypothetical protein
MSNREEFEKWWAETMNINAFDLHFAEGRYYLCHETERSWMTWQATCALKDKEIAQLQTIITEEAKDSAAVIIERDALRSELDAFKAENIALRKVWGERCEEITAQKEV